MPSRTQYPQPAKRFPQIVVPSFEFHDYLESEFNGYILSPGDLPPPEQYNYDGTEKDCPGPFLYEVSKMKTFLGELRFPNHCKLIFRLLLIPCSNAALAIQTSSQSEHLAFFPSSATILLVVWSANGDTTVVLLLPRLVPIH